MIYVLALMPLAVPLAVLVHRVLRPVACPDCGASLPAFMSPFRKTRRMWRVGGRRCTRCGCETDVDGHKVPADPSLPPFPVRRWTAVGFLLVLGVGLGAALLHTGGRPAPPALATPEAPGR